MPVWGWIALLGGAAYLYSKSSTSSTSSTSALPPIPSGGVSAPLAQTSNPSAPNYVAPAPAGYYETVPADGSQPATVAPGTPSTASASGPLYQTGYHEVHTGAPIVRDGWGRTYVHR
jgi:hypothetical protein